ncbi:TetR/AcrR family transcriptional regulator [Nocardioides alkalitolerans]|uniref:TetR/AcrR family transcriptional regulator n=1 Tax=Nocardioides alkalitolerans TaxID=281714 RepID=UPI00041DD1C7|nr:TetR/AcrR family transcriptional regulator [Nocardioides alkalitolerans]
MPDASEFSSPAPRRRSERSRAAILTAALELAVEVPYGRLGIEAIAARAGVGKATIYRWWPSKGAILIDALADANARSAEATYGIPDSGDLEADMAGVLRAIVDELADPGWDALLRALTVETLLDPALRTTVLETIFTPQLAMVARRFTAARTAGQLRDDVDDLGAFELFVAPVFHRWQGGTAPLDHAYADAVAARACRALAP